MFCDRCGAELQPGQRFCSSCGKPAGVAVVPASGQGRVARHIQILALLWLAASALNLVGAAAILFAGNVIFGTVVQIEDGWPMHGFLRGLLTAIGAVVLVKALAGFAAGVGLLQREPWARVLALILGVIALISFPLGTALGIYTLWVLLPAHSSDEYGRLARAA